MNTHNKHTEDTPPTDKLFVEGCPLCMHQARLFSITSSQEFAIACANEAPFGPRETCLLAVPHDDFFKTAVPEAVRYWNEFARAVVAAQKKRAR